MEKLNNLADVCTAAGIVNPEGHGCVERPPIEIVGSLVSSDLTGPVSDVTPLETERDCRLRKALSVFTGNEWSLIVTSLSFTTTNGTDYTTARRPVELSLVTGSGKTADFEAPSTDLGRIRKWVLLNRTVATFFAGLGDASVVVPRDPAGPLLRRLYWRVGPEATGAPGFDWTIGVGLAWQAGLAR